MTSLTTTSLAAQAGRASAAVPVPFFDWAGLYAEHADEFTRIIHETASRGGFILQKEVEEFEASLAAFIGVKHVVGLSDCTHAMLLGLRALDLPAGGEVIMPSHGFIAAAQAIHHANLVPVPVELNDSDWLIDPDAVAAAITSRTCAIMPVHVNGRVCDMDPLISIAEKHGLPIVEDAAQAVGATYRGRAAAGFGKWGAFSFYPSKTLGCFGDAGALATNDGDVYETVLAMRNHGANRDKRIPADCTVWGTNARLDNLHAAILHFKLGYYGEAIKRRRQIATQYQDAFGSIKDLHLPPPPDADPERFDIFQNYEVTAAARRDALREHLAARKIGTIVQWGGLGIHQFRGLGFDQKLPKTDRFFAESLLLPMNHILSDAQVDHVIAAVRDFFAQ